MKRVGMWCAGALGGLVTALVAQAQMPEIPAGDARGATDPIPEPAPSPDVPGVQPTIALGDPASDETTFVVTGLPAVSPDGTRVAVADSEADGGRGNPNLTLRIFDPGDGREVAQVLLLDASEYEELAERSDDPNLAELVEPRLVAARALLGETTWVSLVALEGGDPTPHEAVFTGADGLRVERTHASVAIRGAGAPDYVHDLGTPAPDGDDCGGYVTYLESVWASATHDAAVLAWLFSGIGDCPDRSFIEVVSHRRATAPPSISGTGAWIDPRAAETRLRFGEVHHAERWTRVAEGGEAVAARLRPGESGTVRRDASGLILSGEAMPEVLSLAPGSEVLIGDLLDRTGRRGEVLDEIVVVAPDGTTTLEAWDWRDERRVAALTLAAGVSDEANCAPASYAGAWGLMLLPGPTGGTALAIGNPTHQLRWSPTGWCHQHTAVESGPVPVTSGTAEAGVWSVDLDGDGIVDVMTLHTGGLIWQRGGTGESEHFLIGDGGTTWDPIYSVARIPGWLPGGRSALVATWDFDSDPMDGINSRGETHVYAPAASGRWVQLITVSDIAEASFGFDEDDGERGHYEDRTLYFQRLGDVTLLLKETAIRDVDTFTPEPTELSLSWSWFYIGEAGPLEIDFNYFSWRGPPAEAPDR